MYRNRNKDILENWMIILAGICGLALIAIVIFVIYRIATDERKVDASVTLVFWTNTQQVEGFLAINESAWRELVPNLAYNRSERSEARGSHEEYDGQSCSSYTDSNGKKQESCTNKYRTVTDYDIKVYYTINKWVNTYQLISSGRSNAEQRRSTPYPPEIVYRGRGVCSEYIFQQHTILPSSNQDPLLNCEQLGRLTELYQIAVKSIVGKDIFERNCVFQRGLWSEYYQGQPLTMKQFTLTHDLDCRTIDTVIPSTPTVVATKAL